MEKVITTSKIQLYYTKPESYGPLNLDMGKSQSRIKQWANWAAGAARP